MSDYPPENSLEPIMGRSGIESGGRLAGVKYVPRGRTGGKLVPSISSNVTSSRIALILSLLSLLMVLVLLGLGLSSLSPLPARVAEQHRVCTCDLNNVSVFSLSSPSLS